MRAEATTGRGWLLPAALGCFGLALLLQLLTGQVFYGDGAATFVEGLRHTQAVIWPPERYLSTLLHQALFWPALWLGCTDLDLLEGLFAVGHLAPWPIAIFLCWRLAPAQVWMPLAACGLGYLNSSMIAAGTAHTAHALLWPPLIALTLARPLTPFAASVLLGCSGLLLYSYETQVIMGPLLALLACWRLRGPESRAARLCLLLAGLLLLGSAAVALQGIQSAAHVENRPAYLAGVRALLVAPPWTVTFCALLVAGTLVLLWRPSPTLGSRPVRTALLLGCLAAWGLWPLLAPALFQPLVQYNSRSLNLAVPLALLPVALLAWRHPGWFAPRLPLLRGAAAALLLAQSLWQISATLQWQSYTGALRVYLAAHSGPVPYAGSAIERLETAGRLAHFTLGWTLPYNSLLLADEGRVHSLLWLKTSFMPMDPRRPETVPDLARYGFDLAPYRAALREAADAP